MGGVASNEHRASGTNKISISFSLFSPLTFFFSFTLGRERERGASSLAIGQLAWQLQHTPNKNLVSSKPQQHVIDSHLLRNVLFFFVCLLLPFSLSTPVRTVSSHSQKRKLKKMVKPRIPRRYDIFERVKKKRPKGFQSASRKMPQSPHIRSIFELSERERGRATTRKTRWWEK